MIVTQKINVHLDKQNPTPTLETVQSDTARAVAMTLYAQGTAWIIPDGTVATVRHSICHEGEVYRSTYDTLADGTDAFLCSGSTLTVYLTPEVLSIPGVGELQVGLSCEGELIATLSVLLRVQRNLALEGITPQVRSDLSHQIREAVARQAEEIFDAGGHVGMKLDGIHRRVETPFVLGTLNTGDGVEVSQANRIRSDFFAHGGRNITVTIPEGMKARCFFFDRNHSYVDHSGYYEKSFTIHNGNAYARVVAAYADDSAVSDVEALANQVGIFYLSESHDAFQGFLAALGYGSFAECAAQGYYQFRSSDLSNISDAPPIGVGGILEVHPHGGTNVVFQTIRTTDDQIWFRWGTQSFRRLLPRQERLKWYALGDSITQGYYSDEDGLGLDTDNGWAAVAARENGWVLTNHAVGGSGYVNPATVGDGRNARDHVDTIDFSGAELVTLAFGVNDWKYDCPLGTMQDDVAAGGTLVSNMRYCIEKILTDQPTAKVVVLSPLNSSLYGNLSTNWGAGVAFDNSGTLENVCAAERAVCDYYGVTFVDLLHGSLVNRINAPHVLPDGVHPSPAVHRLLGIELARKLLG